jgi:hypothetical protein
MHGRVSECSSWSDWWSARLRSDQASRISEANMVRVGLGHIVALHHRIGLGRIVASHHRASALYQIR